MQRINRNDKGVTLMILTVTIVVLLIILGITLNYGVSEIHDVSNKKMESELEIVQEAIMQRYALVKSEGQLGIKAPVISSNTQTEANRPSGLVGTRIANSSYIETQGFSGVEPMITYSSGENNKNFEDYYYLLNENDLRDLEIEKGDNPNESGSKERSYIVNYSTGEVFDVGNKKYYQTGANNGDLVYKQPTNVVTDTKNYNFNDDDDD